MTDLERAEELAEQSAPFNMQRAWDRVSGAYNALREDGDEDKGAHVSYGPFAPDEAELALLGPLDGLRVLDLGCGGGHNAVHLARRGAIVTGLDFSARQIEAARATTARHNVEVDFILDDAATLSQVGDTSVDLILAVSVFPYIAAIAQCLHNCRRVLRPRARLVISLDHPFRGCFYDTENQELTSYPAQSYFDAAPRSWPFADTGAMMRTLERPVSAWVDLLHEAGFALQRLLEPPAPAELLDELFPGDGALAGLRNIPHTLIFVAARPPA